MKKPTWFLSKYNTSKPNEWGVNSKIHLDMGCGANPRNPFGAEKLIGADILDPRSLNLGTDFKYLKVDSDGILRKGGVLVLVTPAYPSSAAFQDPTHVNFISDNTVNYFIGKNPLASYLGYGFDGSFNLLTQEWVGPLSFVWARTPLEISESNRKRVVLQFLRGFSSVKSARRVVSSIRKPTHLLWVLQKT